MKVLLDTNTVIHREAAKVVRKDIGLLFNWLDKLHFEKCVHPDTLDEIGKHKDPEVVKTMGIKIGNYNVLKTKSKDDKKILAIREGDKTDNDVTDTNLLKEVYNDRLDYFITEDGGVHKKAKILGISDRVFKIDAFLAKVQMENPGLKDYKVLSVKKQYFGNVNIDDPFFDSFKSDYSEFAKWFNKKSEDWSYVCTTDGQVRAFLYLKMEKEGEDYSNIEPVFKARRRLKIGTFKVESTGFRLGERFLKIIFDNALLFRVQEIYVTIFDRRDEQKRLIDLLSEWGFKFWGYKKTVNGVEKVFVRDFSPNFDLSDLKSTFPYVSNKSRKFLVSISPKYHSDLLPDSKLNNESPADYEEDETYRNSIQKSYITRAFDEDLKPGDILIFKRNKTPNTPARYTSVITSIGIVQEVYRNIKNVDDFIALCKKTTVFSEKDLRRGWEAPDKKMKPFIVNFLFSYSFPKRLILQALLDLEIILDIRNMPRGFHQITDDQFHLIVQHTETDENLIVD